ncbi:hypothetical protein LMH73_008220 [Vibrio splendidus]|nr:hypothetical protein [Vibrio splendidus]MCC4880524.1 hypothetical protein [Vibrio splendidus]
MNKSDVERLIKNAEQTVIDIGSSESKAKELLASYGLIKADSEELPMESMGT